MVAHLLRTCAVVATAFVTLGSSPVGAVTQAFNPYVVHYSVLSTDFLHPEVARIYGVTRSTSRAFLNVVVLKQTAAATATARHVPAVVNVKAVNLLSQEQTIPMRTVVDRGFISYIGDFRVFEGETLNFTINVIPEGEAHPLTIHFQEQFFD